MDRFIDNDMDKSVNNTIHEFINNKAEEENINIPSSSQDDIDSNTKERRSSATESFSRLVLGLPTSSPGNVRLYVHWEKMTAGPLYANKTHQGEAMEVTDERLVVREV